MQGPSFTVDGNLVNWQRWQFRVDFNYREGMVLHQIGYRDNDGPVRPVMHRISSVEMAVPYVDRRHVQCTSSFDGVPQATCGFFTSGYLQIGACN